MGKYVQSKGGSLESHSKESGFGDLVNSGLYVTFTHVPTGHLVRLPAALESFDDTFTTNTSAESVYGRMDDIVIYKSTGREITARIKIVPYDVADAQELLAAVGTLQKFLYPTYGENKLGTGKAVSVTTIDTPPLIRTKLANLITNPAGLGLLGFMKQFSLAPDIDAGFITTKIDNQVALLPKQYSMDFNFKVLHDHDLGWSKAGNFLEPSSKFPHGIHHGAPKPPPAAKPKTKEQRDREAANREAHLKATLQNRNPRNTTNPGSGGGMDH